MKSVLLIGLGRFGRHMALKLHELKHEIMAVDSSEERVNEVLPFVTTAQSETVPTSSSSPPWACETSTCAWWPSAMIFRALWRPPLF